MFKEQSVFYRIASRKSSLFRFTHLFSSHAVLVPPRPHRRSSALYWRSIWHHRERKRKIFMGQPGGRVYQLHSQIARCRFGEEGRVERSLRFQAKWEVV